MDFSSIQIANLTDFVLTDDGKLAYITTSDGQLLRWDVEEKAFLSPLTLGGALSSVDISPDGTYLLVGRSNVVNATPDDGNWPAYVGQPADLIAQALAGRMPLQPRGEAVDIPDFLVFHRGAANFPWRSQALWIYSQFLRWGMAEATPEAERAASGVFRSDLYRRALAGRGIPMPGASSKVEGAIGMPLDAGAHQGSLTLAPDRFFDGRSFDPDSIPAYVEALGGGRRG